MSKNVLLPIFGVVCLCASLAVTALAKQQTPLPAPAQANYVLFCGTVDSAIIAGKKNQVILRMNTRSGETSMLRDVDSNATNWQAVKD